MTIEAYSSRRRPVHDAVLPVEPSKKRPNCVIAFGVSQMKRFSPKLGVVASSCSCAFRSSTLTVLSAFMSQQWMKSVLIRGIVSQRVCSPEAICSKSESCADMRSPSVAP